MAGSPAAVAQMKKIALLMQDSGLTVRFSSGWEDRGRSGDVAYWAVLAHHTAATSDIDTMLIQGRGDLPGPLCNWALHQDGIWVAIASGRANHAGVGTLPSSESYGIEATGPFGYPGTFGPRAFPEYDAYTLGCACILAVLGGDTGDLFGHKETARPLGRKIDPWFNMDDFRRATAAEVPGEEDDLTPEQAADLAQIKKDVAKLKEETILQRTGQPEMDSVWYAWRRLNEGNEGTPTKTYSLRELADQLDQIQQAVTALAARLPS